MIRTLPELRITQRKLAGMRARIDRLRAKYSKNSDFHFYSEITQSQIKQMQRDLDSYALKQGDVDRADE
jgi:hypothetical protein